MGELLEWWALSDLNGRPFGCKPNALTAELSARSEFIVQEAARAVNARANASLLFAEPCPIFALVAEGGAGCCAPTVGDFRANVWVSLHFIGAASKLTLLRLCKVNSLRCFSYGTL